MIEYYSPHKKIWLKVIASVLVVTFLWQDIAGAADLYSYTPADISNLFQKKLSPKELSKLIDITNYDQLYYNKRQSAADKLLPPGRESESSQKFSPGYVQEQQQKHEEIIRQKQGEEDLLWALQDNLRKRLQKGEEEDWNLKKKRGGGIGMGGGNVDYTMTDPDGQQNSRT